MVRLIVNVSDSLEVIVCAMFTMYFKRFIQIIQMVNAFGLFFQYF